MNASPYSKYFSFFILSFCMLEFLYAQSESQGNNQLSKIVKSSTQLNKNSKEIQEASSEVNNQVQQAGININTAAQNVKSIIRVFEPIFKLHQKKIAIDDSQTIATNQTPAAATQEIPAVHSIPAETSTSPMANSQPPFVPAAEPSYNADGSANLGNQNHKQYGCYLDAVRGTVMDDIDASAKTSNVDIVYTATDYYGSAPMYALLTPSYVKNDVFANYYFRGSKYKDSNIPIRQWDNTNESEIALTGLTPDKFEKIQNNNQLMSIIKQTAGFKDKYESRSKLNGKVFAVRTHLENRDAYGLICVLDHIGTTGVNGFLKIKIKVTGFDNNGDGNPDIQIYK